MPDVAALNLKVDSDDVKQATVSLREMAPAATAAETAAKRWGLATDAATRSTDDFSKRVQGTIKSLEFERQQLSRTSEEQAKFSALRRAGVSASSAEGQAIAASVAALQAQRAASKGASEATTVGSTVTKAAGHVYGELVSSLKSLALAYVGVEAVRKFWEAGMKAGDLGEQAEQVNLTTEQLQAYRFEAAQDGVEVEKLDGGLIRLTATMGQALRGGKDQIEIFQKLGVNLLDARGELRATSDVLPELARGILKVSSETERNSILTELFGKSGARMVTMLQAWAKGNDALVASARAQGGILEAEVIDAWDKVGDAMKRASLAADVTNAKLGAPIATSALEAIEKLLRSINTIMDQINSKEGFWSTILSESRANGRMGGLRLETPEEIAARRRAELQGELANPANAGREAMIQADLDRMNNAELQNSLAGQGAIQSQGAPSAKISRFLPTTPSVGVSNPTPKGSGSDPYAKAIESAKEYTALKNAETAAIGLNVAEAEKLKHEQELINKASADANTLTPVQIANLKQLAAAMAEADARFARAKFMDDAVTKSNEFIAAQNIERETLFMSSEAAAAYRIEQEALNDAKKKGIDLSAADTAKLHELAASQAAAGERTRQTKELVDLGRDAFQGFFSDLSNGLRQGQSAWDAFGNAATNALDKIADKLLQMAVDDLFNQAFGKSGGGGGGFLSGIGSWIGGLFGGGAGGFNPGLPTTPGMGTVNAALGRVYASGNVIPFARGGIVHRPTLFPMANGTGLMGEAGPEAVVPLRRGKGGRLGIDASGAGGGDVVVNVYNNANGTTATARQSKGPGGQTQIDVIVEAVESKMAGRVSRGQGSLGKTMEGTYGLQRVGR